MALKVDIKERYTGRLLYFKSYAKGVTLPPQVDGVLKNLETGEVDSVSNKFRVDTGCEISIINSKYKEFVSTLKPIDFIDVKYGSGATNKDCPVYKVGIIIKGYELELTVVYDEIGNFLLLGHYQFLEYHDCFFNSSQKKLRIFKG